MATLMRPPGWVPTVRAAALDGDIVQLNRMLAQGADPNQMDNISGYTPLLYAVSKGHVDCVARLLEAGANVNYGNAAGWTPLNLAASTLRRSADMCRLLLAGGAQFDFDPSGLRSAGSPLHYAIQNANLPAIRVLLAAGADPNNRKGHISTQNRSPLASAVGKITVHVPRRSKIPTLLLRAGASINDPEVTAFFQNLNDPQGHLDPHKRKAIAYLRAVHAAGSFPAYEKGHRSMFAALFSRGNRLPADVIPKIVEYWAHLGYYQYQIPGTGGTGSGTGSRKSNLPVGTRN